jgi:hypothetical protein
MSAIPGAGPHIVVDSSKVTGPTDVPVVECHCLAQRAGWDCDIWVIDECPFCGDRHIHGAGEGLRSSHCQSGSVRSYYLVEQQRDLKR